MTKLTAALMMSSTLAHAHEVVPTIADLTVEDGKAELTLQINLEAFLAEVNLNEFENINDAPQAQGYDTLRAMPADALAEQAGQLLPKWNALPVLSMGGKALTLNSIDVSVPTVSDFELARVTSWVLQAQGVEPGKLTVAWPYGSGDMVLRQQGVDEPFTGLINGGGLAEISLSGGDALSGWQTFVSYIPVGFDHILPKGLDHILFVLGLFFLSTRLRPLIWQVSAFTLAHTVTLALGALGLVNVPGSIVEPLIAASIVYVAVENIFASGLNPWRAVVIFGFGLLHGLGFASVLGDFGLPSGQFVPALIGFNIGVELGQLTVIAIAFIAVGWAIRKSWYRRAIAIPASCVIAAIGAYWVVERTLL
ncbi:Membrane protein [Sulfitobacter donghicola DSW-25 = KCTC 12864 = JCM 14565]|nr:Membrane protein [Sulfitobacter donghicola DSW-25 = KCTC 12864 = JCM 14565]